MYRLEFRFADGSTRSFDEQRVLRIGRGRNSDIVLDSRGVSRNHAELRPTDTGWDLYDTGSTGGTWVSNQRVTRVPLGATTTVRFGTESNGVQATITVDLPDAAAGEAPDEQDTVLPNQQSTVVPGTGQLPGHRATGLLIRTRNEADETDPCETNFRDSHVSMTQDKYWSRGRIHPQVADLLDRTVINAE
jgi:putative serine protease PepD